MTDEALFIVRFAVPIGCGIVVSVIDQRERRIPNWASIPLLVAGLLFRVATAGRPGLVDALGGFAVGFTLFFLLWISGGGGAGDVKFMAGVGAWLGAYHLVMVFVLSAIVLAVLMIVMLAARLVTRRGRGQSDSSASQPADGAENKLLRWSIPYALPATVAIGLRLAWMLLIRRFT